MGNQLLPPGRVECHLKHLTHPPWVLMSGSAQKEERNPTSDFAARSGEHGAVRAADVVVAHFHAEVPLPHAAQRHLHHAHVRRLQSHPPPLATSTERKMT